MRPMDTLSRTSHALAAHDLKEPLATIALFAGTLKGEHGGALDPRALRLLEGIEEGIDRMRDTIDRTLATAETTGSRHWVVDMNRVVDEALRELEARTRTTGAIVRVDSLPEVHGDPVELIRLMQNLIGNAIKFGGADGRPHVWLSGEGSGELATISVRDNGRGLSAAQAARVFEPFERGDPFDPSSGSGLGLTIARRIVEDHGGEISISPSSRRGTVVRFTLPCADCDSDSLQEERAS